MPNENLEFGSGIHAALDYYYKPALLQSPVSPGKFFERWMNAKIKSIDSQFEDEIASFCELKGLGIKMLKGYVKKWEGNEGFDVLATEKTLRRKLPMPGEKKMSKCFVVVRLDGIVRCHRTEKLFSLEHKTFRRFTPKDLELDPQYTAQVWVGQKYANLSGLDEPVVGVIYNGLRKQAPGPKVTVPLFERHRIYRNNHEIKSFLHRAYWQYKESRTWEIYPQPSTVECGMCDFTEPCIERMRGGDYEYLLKHKFTKRREYHGKGKERSTKKRGRRSS